VTEPAALVFEERGFSLPELDAMADGLAATLTKMGVAAGERVAVMASNRPEFVTAVHAIWRLGAARYSSVPHGSTTRSTTHLH